MNYSLENKVAIITGASQGLGLEISRKYIMAGASVMLCARETGRLEREASELTKLLKQGQTLEAFSVDVSLEGEVGLMVENIIKRHGRIDILVNNAGIYGPMGPIESVDWLHWKKAIDVNLFGSILMCRLVVPYMKKQKSGKIIQLSGGGATNPLPNISAYAVSKAAIVRFAETLAEELREFGVDVNSIAPGALNTRMLDEVLSAGPENVGKNFYEKSVKQKQNGGAGLEAGAELAVFLGSAVSNGITAKLISAVWDNWQEWPKHLAKLNNSDAYTIRRIAGRERDFSLGDK